jgi:hypothetical protein
VEHDDTVTFRLPGRWQVVLVVTFLLPSFCLLLLSPLLGVLALAAMALYLALVLRYYTVQLRPDGVKLYGLWWLPWTDVRAVSYRRLFGLPYFRVRRRGFSWWIPLYFIGDRDLGQALIHAAPSDNPFRSASIPS